VQLFGTKGQKFHHCPGTTGQAKNQAKGRAGTDKIRAGTQDKTGQTRNVLKQERMFEKQKIDVLKQEIWPDF
jgi:hypothetical protein